MAEGYEIVLNVLDDLVIDQNATVYRSVLAFDAKTNEPFTGHLDWSNLAAIRICIHASITNSSENSFELPELHLHSCARPRFRGIVEDRLRVSLNPVEKVELQPRCSMVLMLGIYILQASNEVPHGLTALMLAAKSLVCAYGASEVEAAEWLACACGSLHV